MNSLLASLKGKKSQLWLVMSQDEIFFELPDLSQYLSFDAKYKPEAEEWFCLDRFSKLGYKNPLIGVPFNTTNYNQLSEENYQKINYFCAKQGNFLLFQKFVPSQFLMKRWFRISKAPKLEKDQPIMTLNSDVHAVYDIFSDKLYFKDFAKLNGIFEGIEDLYRTATREEVNDFLNKDFIFAHDGYSAMNVHHTNRKLIALTLDTLKKITEERKNNLIAYIKSYCPEIPIEGNAFKINSNKQLNRILLGFDERYYTTELSLEKRMANSVQKLPEDIFSQDTFYKSNSEKMGFSEAEV